MAIEKQCAAEAVEQRANLLLDGLVIRPMRLRDPLLELLAIDRPEPEEAVLLRSSGTDAQAAPRSRGDAASTAARGVVALTAPQPRWIARPTSLSTSGSSSVVSDGFPPDAIAMSQSGYSRPECGTDRSTGSSPRGGWMIGRGRVVWVNLCASLRLYWGPATRESVIRFWQNVTDHSIGKPHGTDSSR